MIQQFTFRQQQISFRQRQVTELYGEVAELFERSPGQRSSPWVVGDIGGAIPEHDEVAELSKKSANCTRMSPSCRRGRRVEVCTELYVGVTIALPERRRGRYVVEACTA